jgi:hypothetical protein
MLEDTHSGTSSQAQDSGQLQLDLSDGLTTENYLQGHVLASRLVWQGSSKEPMIQGICGRTYIDSSVKLNQLSPLVSKCLERLAMIGSTESPMILSRAVTPQKRSIYRLAPSMRHTNGTGCTGAGYHPLALSKPKESKHNAPGNNQSINLMRGYMPDRAQWPTPTANPDNKTPEAHLAMKERMGGNRKTITDCQVAMKAQSGMWVTPSARDWKDSAGMTTQDGDRNRIDQCPRQMAAQATGATIGSNATTEKRGAPNPVFAFWLMGWPLPMQICVAKELQSFRKTGSRRGG